MRPASSVERLLLGVRASHLRRGRRLLRIGARRGGRAIGASHLLVRVLVRVVAAVTGSGSGHKLGLVDGASVDGSGPESRLLLLVLLHRYGTPTIGRRRGGRPALPPVDRVARRRRPRRALVTEGVDGGHLKVRTFA